MTADRLQKLLAPFVRTPLAADQYAQLLTYLELLLKWNAKTNLTAVRDPEQIVQRHFGESLALAEEVFQESSPTSAADLGSGAGFPGLPLGIYAPELQVTLVESHNKKATFLKEVVRTLDLNNVHVFNDRGEKLTHRFDLVTMRAVEKFDDALKVAQSLTRPGGRIALLVSGKQLPVAQRLALDWDFESVWDFDHGGVVLIGRSPER